MQKILLVIITAIILIGSVNATKPIGEIAYYNFDEGEGNILNDNSENNYQGVVYGDAIWIKGFSKNALSFDGVDDYVDILNTSDLNFQSGFTLSTWVRFNSYNSDSMIIGKHISGIVAGYFIGIQNNKLDFYVSNSPLPDNKQRLRTPNNYDDNQWHHIAGVYDGTSQYLYVDGVLIAKQMQEYSTINSANIRIGGMFQGENNGVFIGDIDEVRIYNRALSKEEVYELANPIQKPDLEERVERLEQKVEGLEERINILEVLVNKIKNYFWFFPDFIKRGILCEVLEESGETEIKEWELKCELKQLRHRNMCVCKKI